MDFFFALRLTTMKQLLFLLFPSFLIPIESDGQIRNKRDLEQHLVGIWVKQPDKDLHALRYVKSDTLVPNRSNFYFQPHGQLIFRDPFGCQVPVPHFRDFYLKWWTRGKQYIKVDYGYPKEKPHTLKILSLNKNVLRVIWLPR